jgi:hypothetical protein
MGVLDKDLSDEQQHAFFEVKRPDIDRPTMLDVVVEKLLWLQDGQQMSESMCMLD